MLLRSDQPLSREEREDIRGRAKYFFGQNALAGPKRYHGDMTYGGWGDLLFSAMLKDNPLRYTVVEERNPYYIGRDQPRLIGHTSRELYETVGDADVLVDFGCGLRSQMLPLMEECIRAEERPRSAVMIDISNECVQSASSQIRSLLRDHYSVMPIHGDYFNPLPKLPEGKKVGFLGGASLNFLDLGKGLTKIFHSARAALGTGSHLVMVIDTNQNVSHVQASYDTHMHAAQEKSVLGVYAQAGVNGIDRSAWDYVNKTTLEIDSNGLSAVVSRHQLSPHEMQTVSCDDWSFKISAGETLDNDLSWKPPIETVEFYAKRAGAVLEHSIYTKGTTLETAVFRL